MSEIPAKADLATALLDAATIAEHFRNYGETTLVTDIGNMATNNSWTGSEPMRQSSRIARSRAASLFVSMCSSLYTPILFGFLKAAGRADLQSLSAEAFQAIREYMAEATAVSVQDRGITHTTTLSSVTGSGSPTMRNVAVDEDGRALEAVWPQDIVLRANRVGALTKKLSDSFYFELPSAIDALSYRVSGEDKAYDETFQTNYILRNEDNGTLRNMSFDVGVTTATVNDTAIGSTVAGTVVNNWTVVTAPTTDTTQLWGVGDEYGYRPSVREYAVDTTKRACWHIKDDCKYSQTLPPLAKGGCYDAGIWVRRKSSATGSFVLTVGGVTVTVDISTLTNDTWTFVGLPQNENNWQKAIGTGDTFAFAVSSLATGTIKVDASEFRAMVEINGTMWGAIASATDMTANFEATLNATFPDQGLIQQHIAYGFKDSVGRDAFLNSSSTPTIDESGI